jgi:hypothetical protein
MSNKIIKTPRGIAIWPKLNEPDFKFKDTGEFHTKLAFEADDPEVVAFIAKLEEARDAEFDAQYNRLVEEKKLAVAKKLTKVEVATPEVDDETGDETGRLILRVKMNHRVKSKKSGEDLELRPKYFNAKTERLENPPRIGGGSLLRAFVIINPYLRDTDKTVGVSLRLDAVQIIKLVTSGGRSAAEYGMEEEDGDDITDGAPAAPKPSAGYSTEDDGDDDL